VVLPVPGWPSTRKRQPLVKPPNRTSSSPATPEAATFDGVLTLTPYSSWRAPPRSDVRLCHKHTAVSAFHEGSAMADRKAPARGFCQKLAGTDREEGAVASLAGAKATATSLSNAEIIRPRYFLSPASPCAQAVIASFLADPTAPDTSLRRRTEARLASPQWPRREAKRHAARALRAEARGGEVHGGCCWHLADVSAWWC